MDTIIESISGLEILEFARQPHGRSGGDSGRWFVGTRGGALGRIHWRT